MIMGYLLMVSLNSPYEYSDWPNNKKIMKKEKTYLALGDSYTIGESVSENERWPVLLAAHLNMLEYSIKPPRIIAKTGWTTGELKAAIKEAAIKTTFDLVSLSIGVNNQYRNLSVEEYRKEYVELLDIAIAFAGGNPDKVFVISIPDWGKSPFAKDRNSDVIAKEIDQFNAVKKEEESLNNKKRHEYVQLHGSCLIFSKNYLL